MAEEKKELSKAQKGGMAFFILLLLAFVTSPMVEEVISAIVGDGDQTYWVNTSYGSTINSSYNRNVNLTDYWLQTDEIMLDNSALQSILWFRIDGINRASFFFDEATDLIGYGTYTGAGAWNGYSMQINTNSKGVQIFGNLTVNQNLTVGTLNVVSNSTQINFLGGGKDICIGNCTLS